MDVERLCQIFTIHYHTNKITSNSIWIISLCDFVAGHIYAKDIYSNLIAYMEQENILAKSEKFQW
jgi:hypothetical protein